jgi:thymidylate synthase (FAD)
MNDSTILKWSNNTLHARLISHSQPTHRIHAGELAAQGLNNIQDLIAYAARVSNPTNQANTKTTSKLLDYLIKHKHWSPFEMASACIEITTTRDIARQLLRHRSFSFQEFSQRYADIRDLDDNFVIRDARLQDPKNRQNSVEADDPALSGEWNMRQQDVIDTAKKHYSWAIENGIAKEQARAVLPEGNTVSKLYVNGTIRSWIHYIDLRSANGTQLEHMELARAVGKAIGLIYPKALEFITED